MPKIVIELAGDKNQNHLFQPTQEKLRGRWDMGNVLGRRMHESMTYMPKVIPGIQIMVDTDKSVCARVDPLSLAEYKDVWAKIENVADQFPMFFQKSKPLEPVFYTDCSPTVIKTWLYWMRRLVDSKAAVVIGPQSSLPSMREIECMPGKTQISQFNSMATRKMTREESLESGDGLVRPNERDSDLVGAGSNAGSSSPDGGGNSGGGNRRGGNKS